jgi:hypothetical protein
MSVEESSTRVLQGLETPALPMEFDEDIGMVVASRTVPAEGSSRLGDFSHTASVTGESSTTVFADSSDFVTTSTASKSLCVSFVAGDQNCLQYGRLPRKQKKHHPCQLL